VPAQALILMNSPFVVEQANNWAARLIQEQPNTGERIVRIYQQAFSREPSEVEIEQAIAFLSVQAQEVGIDASQVDSHQEIWADFCHVILNVKEFIYLR
jgi:hypothetical protein